MEHFCKGGVVVQKKKRTKGKRKSQKPKAATKQQTEVSKIYFPMVKVNTIYGVVIRL